jgi:hypothetical protein
LKQEKHCSDESIVAWGYSLGSGAVSELAIKHPVDVVIDRGFSSMGAVAYDTAPTGLKTVAKVMFVVGSHFNNCDKLVKAEGSIFVAQGILDTTMKQESHGEKLKKLAEKNQNIIYKEVNSRHAHGAVVWFQEGEDQQKILDFLNRASLT